VKIIGIIPARYNSTRFPGKPLIEIEGKTMIERVYQQAMKAKCLKGVCVATDDERIFQAVKSFAGQVVMTGTNHQSGTDRCWEAVQKLGGDYEAVLNIQGDEPFVSPHQIDLLAKTLIDSALEIATLAKEIEIQKVQNPNIVKIVLDRNNRALYFSRAVIPFHRNPNTEKPYYKHIGLYAFSTKALAQITQLPVSSLEAVEGLEQLRWLENGWSIKVGLTEEEALSVDTEGDLRQIQNWLRTKKD